MADANTIKLVIALDANQAIDGFARVDGSAKRFDRTLSSLDRTVSSAASTMMQFASAIAAWMSFDRLIESAYRYNRTIEDTRLGIASLAYTLQEYRDAHGRVLSGMEALNAAYVQSGKVQEQLRIEGLKTAATYEQLSQAFTQAFTPAVAAGFNTDQIVKFTTAVVQAATAMGMNLNQLGEEVRSVLSGTMTSMNTRLKPLMDAVGLTNEKIKELAQNGKLYDAMMQALSGATMAADRASKSLGVSLSNLADAGQSILGIGLKPFFDALAGAARDLSDKLFQVKDNTIIWNEKVLSAVSTVGDAMAGMVRTIMSAGTTSNFYKENKALIDGLLELATAMGGVYIATRAMMILESAGSAMTGFANATMSATSAMGLAQKSVLFLGSALTTLYLLEATGQIDGFTSSLREMDLTLANIKRQMSSGMTEAGMAGLVGMMLFGSAGAGIIIGSLVAIIGMVSDLRKAWNTGDASVLERWVPAKFQNLIDGLTGSMQHLQQTARETQAVFADDQIERWLASGKMTADEMLKSLADMYKHGAISVEEFGAANNRVLRYIEQQSVTVYNKQRGLTAEQVKAAQKAAEERLKVENWYQDQMSRYRLEAARADNNSLQDRLRALDLQIDEELKKIEREGRERHATTQQIIDLESAAWDAYWHKRLDMQADAHAKERAQERQSAQALINFVDDLNKEIVKADENSLEARLNQNRQWLEDHEHKLAELAEKHNWSMEQILEAESKLQEAYAVKNLAAQREYDERIAKEAQDALDKQIKAWDHAYERISDTLADWLAAGKASRNVSMKMRHLGS